MIEDSETPAWPTTLRSRLRDGRLLGTDGSVWLYRAVPMSPVVDAKTPGDALEAAEPILAVYEELAAMASYTVARRSLAKSGYRETHLLLVNTPQFFVPDPAHPIAEYLRQSFGHMPIDRRVLLIGVRLQAKVGGAGGGLRAAIESVTETLLTGGTPLSDYDSDFERVDAALTRAGCIEASTEEIRLANAWWNHGDFPDTPLLVHADHLHVFTSAEAVRIADEVGVNDCHTWDERGVPGQHAVSFASVQDIELPFIDTASLQAAWVADLIGAEALVVSVRGQVEPGQITRQELRRQRKRYIDDINERHKQGKMERAEQQEMLATLSQVESMYATGGSPPPTLAGTSIVVGFAGMLGDVNQIIPSRSPAKMSVMLYRQPGAMAETMLCSGVRANPNLHDLPTQTIACSGAPSLNLVGDADGALIGFTERDRQPAYMSPAAASATDASPICVVPGQTGPQPLDTRIPVPVSEKFPAGWARFGDLAVGDLVFTRRGTTTRIVELKPIRTQARHTVRLSDGQEIECGDNHLWAVSDFAGRSSQSPSYVARTDADKEVVRARADRLRYLAEQAVGRRATVTTICREYGLASRTVRAAVLGVESTVDSKTVIVPGRKKEFLVSAIVDDLKNNEFRGVDGVSPTEAIERLHALGDAWLGAVEVYSVMTADAPVTATQSRWVRHRCSEAKVPFRRVASSRVIAAPHYAVEDVLNALADAQEAQADQRMPVVKVATTAEMMVSLQRTAGGVNWALPVAHPVNGPVVDLPVDPYVFGAWLGDGGAHHACVTSADPEIVEEIVASGYAVRRVKDLPGAASNYFFEGLRADLLSFMPWERSPGGHKKMIKGIPAIYRRASVEQRLALLQGLMDTDGTVSVDGACELSLCNEALITDALEVIRSLGIKARIRESDASITEDDPDNPGETRNRVTGRRWRIVFTPTTQVFRLGRKAARIKAEARASAGWLYVEDITVGEPVEMRCITIEDSEHLYLTDGFVPTHNSGKTVAMLSMADQFSRSGRPVVIWDPKAMPLDTPVPTPSGWSTIGEISPGEQVYGRDGLPCTVVDKSEVFAASQTRVFEFRLDDGQVLSADADHQWVAYSVSDRERLSTASPEARLRWRERHLRWSRKVADLAVETGDSDTVTTQGLMRRVASSGVEATFEDHILDARLTVRGLIAVRGTTVALWPTGVALKAVADMLRRDADAPFGQVLTTEEMIATGDVGWGFPVAGPVEGGPVEEGRCDLDSAAFGRRLGHDVHRIPMALLRAPASDRRRLLDGLLADIDAHGESGLEGGFVTCPRGSVRVSQIAGRVEIAVAATHPDREGLVDDVLDLLRGLGFKATSERTSATALDSAGRGPAVSFVRAPRSDDFHLIQQISRIDSVEAQCLSVDSPDHTYLVAGFVVSHNTESDHSPVVEASGGQIYSLDTLLASDGAFDPIRFSGSKEVGVELAASMLMGINPWGDYRNNMEVPLQHALAYGVERGAQCIGQALAIAKRDLELPQGLVERIELLATSSPQFRAIVGVNPQGAGLRAAEGITLIKVGSAYLDLPEPGQQPSSIQQKIALALVRMVVFGSAMAVSGRDGVVMLDEAWIVLGAGRAEIERLGRLARSQQVLPMLFTQRVTDALNAGLAGYISRGLILPMEDPTEAAAACELFKLEPTPGRMHRLTAKATMGGNSAVGKAPNWSSMRALRDPVTGQVLRGSVAIYADLAGRAIPVEIRLSDEFLLMASTNPNDIRKRNELMARRRLELNSAANAALEAPDTGTPELAI